MDEIFDLILGTQTTKGGKGSGNFGHAGRPGEVGGSAPNKGGTPEEGGEIRDSGSDKKLEKYNSEAYTSMDIPSRKDAWEKLSESKRDQLANAKESILAYEQEILGDIGERPNSGDIEKDVSERLYQARDLITMESSDAIKDTMLEMSGVLDVAKVNPEVANQIIMESTDALIAQEYEAASRQLGDHGIHHIKGDIDDAVAIMKAVPGADSSQDIASAYIAGIYHDTGYLTEPSRDFLDEGHARWSAEHYDTYIKDMVTEAMGDRVANNITHMIRTHQATNIDWKEDTVASAFRVADNIALFQEEKLPPLFRFVDGSIDVLEQYAEGKLSQSAMRSQLRSLINSADLSGKLKTNMQKAVMEINPFSPKALLGMLAGNLDSVEWADDHLRINLRRNKEADRLTKLLDLGQKQFGKLAKTYGEDPKKFLKDLNFFFKDKSGTPLLEGRIVGELKERFEKELAKAFAQLDISKDIKKN